jgi:hypothetical protein
VTGFRDSQLWGEAVYVIPEHAFGVDVGDRPPRLSAEPAAVRWVSCAEARRRLRFESNLIALREFNQKIRGLGPRDCASQSRLSRAVGNGGPRPQLGGPKSST